LKVLVKTAAGAGRHAPDGRWRRQARPRQPRGGQHGECSTELLCDTRHDRQPTGDHFHDLSFMLLELFSIAQPELAIHSTSIFLTPPPAEK